jgi:preprotein translocase subunit SecA
MAGRGVDIKLGEGVLELGGLYVIGTERHESRRIDNQLRGRSGRQGDAGESRFFISGEDDLVRLFAGDRIARVMEMTKMPEDQPLDSKMLSRQIEGAQKKVEEMNFVSRKNVLKYDDVMNKQRTVIYEQRRRVLEGQDLHDEVIEQVVGLYIEVEGEDLDLEGLVLQMQALYGTDITVDELRSEVELSSAALVEEFQQDAQDAYAERTEEWGPEITGEVERFFVLQVVDTRWREHLENMEYLREGVHLRAMAQKDPLVEYTAEGHKMFDELGSSIREEVVLLLFHAEVERREDEELGTLPQQTGPGNGNLQYAHESLAGADAIAAAAGGEAATATAATSVGATVVASEHEKLGRNDPCWCGSGKKFKRCHGA